MAEQLICNQQVVGSTPITSSNQFYMERFPSGQREQTVNLLSTTSVVRIHLSPPQKGYPSGYPFCDCREVVARIPTIFGGSREERVTIKAYIFLKQCERRHFCTIGANFHLFRKTVYRFVIEERIG